MSVNFCIDITERWLDEWSFVKGEVPEFPGMKTFYRLAGKNIQTPNCSVRAKEVYNRFGSVCFFRELSVLYQEPVRDGVISDELTWNDSGGYIFTVDTLNGLQMFDERMQKSNGHCQALSRMSLVLNQIIK